LSYPILCFLANQTHPMCFSLSVEIEVFYLLYYCYKNKLIRLLNYNLFETHGN
jgi:hypothetical protein